MIPKLYYKTNVLCDNHTGRHRKPSECLLGPYSGLDSSTSSSLSYFGYSVQLINIRQNSELSELSPVELPGRNVEVWRLPASYTLLIRLY